MFELDPGEIFSFLGRLCVVELAKYSVIFFNDLESILVVLLVFDNPVDDPKAAVIRHALLDIGPNQTFDISEHRVV